MLSCVNSVSYKLLLNRSTTKSFSLSYGLRQGDPISLLLFIICAEMFTRLIEKEEENGKLQGIRICRGAPAVSHLLYADDILITYRANAENARAIEKNSPQVLCMGWPASKS